MRIILGAAVVLSEVIVHAATGTWGWHTPVIVGLIGGGFYAAVAGIEASDRRQAAIAAEERLRTNYCEKLTEEEAQVILAMRSDRKALR